MKISYAECERLGDAIAFATTRIYRSTTNKDPSPAFVSLMTHEMLVDYFKSIGIDEIEEE